MLAGPLGLQGTLLLGGVLNNGLHLLETLLSPFLKATACGGTEFSGLLGTCSDRGVLLHLLLGHIANLLRPLGAVCGGGVSGCVIGTLLLHNGLTLDNIVLDVVDLLLGPALGFVLSPADLGSLHITVLHKRGPADLSGLIEGNLLVLNEAALPEVLVTVLLLLRLVLCDIGGVAPPVIGVVALDNLVVLGLLNHLHLVNAPLAVVSGPGRSNRREANIGVIASLSLVSRVKTSEGSTSRFFMVIVMVVTMVTAVMVVPTVGVEREGVDKGTRITVVRGRPCVPS